MTKKKDLLNFSYRVTSDLIPYARNAKIHTDEQITKIAASIREFGFMSPVVLDKDNTILAGHGRVLAAKKLGMKEVPAVQAEHLSEAQRKAYILADNRTAEEHSGWDMEMLSLELEDLGELEYDYANFMDFGDIDVSELSTNSEDSTGDPTHSNKDAVEYTNKVEAPIYTPKESKAPLLAEVYNTKKTEELSDKIDRSGIPEDVKEFLKHAASRHIKFRYDRIAEYYCHASKEVQELMEESALVIIDFNKAVEHGFATMSEKLKEAYDEQVNSKEL